jgi:hypothetical protein
LKIANSGAKEATMHVDTAKECVAQVAACTAAAAHRRDHNHPPSTTCHPHAVEVVHLGHRAVTVCHDCASDSGFLPQREAEAVALTHRTLTLGSRSPSWGGGLTPNLELTRPALKGNQDEPRTVLRRTGSVSELGVIALD